MSALLPGVRSVQRQVGPFAASWRASNDRELGRVGTLWVAIGDSMTQGIGASVPEAGWVGQLHERWAAQGHSYRLVNLAVTGARVQDVLDHQLPALRRLAALGHEPALVTVLIGSNDIFSRQRRGDVVERFEQVLDQLPTGSVVANLPNSQREARAMDALVRERVPDGRLRLADMRRDGPRTWVGMLAPDWFHPNDKGYTAMADVVDAAVDHARRV
jgi:lysophospholipase L1-like esterase